MKKILLILFGIILIITATILYHLGSIDSGVMMIIAVIAGLSVGAVFNTKKNK